MIESKLTIVLMAGLPGSGKSTVAKALGEQLGWPVLDKDVVKSALVSVGGSFDPDRQSYEVLFRLAHELAVGQGQSVIIDSPASSPEALQQVGAIAAEAEAELKVVLCVADQDTRNRRLHERGSSKVQPGTPSQTKGNGQERYPFLNDLARVVDTTRPLNELVRELLAYLR